MSVEAELAAINPPGYDKGKWAGVFGGVPSPMADFAALARQRMEQQKERHAAIGQAEAARRQVAAYMNPNIYREPINDPGYFGGGVIGGPLSMPRLPQLDSPEELASRGILGRLRAEINDWCGGILRR
jgi:hypothetical protein